MLSFLMEHQTKSAVDVSTSGSSAFVYTGGTAQVPQDTTRLRVDRSVKHISSRVDYGRIFSMEVPDTVNSLDVNLTQGTSCVTPSSLVYAMSTRIADWKGRDVFKNDGFRHLRNVAFPPALAEKDLPTFDNTSDLGRVLPSRRNRALAFSFLCNGYALRERFARLPLHAICYYHSHGTAEAALRDLSEELGRHSTQRHGRDCLGFTPLHILACSTKHHIDMYKLVVERYPEHLITGDAWGDENVPLLYLLWGRAPQEIVNFLTSQMKRHHPNYEVDWYKMIKTLSIAMAPTACFKYFIDTICQAFPRQVVELQSVDLGHVVGLLCVNAKASEDHVKSFINTYRTALPENDTDLSCDFLRFVLREKFGFRSFWIEIGVAARLSALPKRGWREEIAAAVRACPTGSSDRLHRQRVAATAAVLDRLDLYECVAQMWVLELALWKSRITEAGGAAVGEDRDAEYRSRCRFTAGAEAIVPNVMSYLQSKRVHGPELWDLLPRSPM